MEGIYVTIGIVKRAVQLDFYSAAEQKEEVDPYAGGVEWMLCFPDVLDENGRFTGFDAVIGNPPYIQLQRDGGALADLYGGLGYEVFERTGDIYCLFYERATQLLKAGGILCFITLTGKHVAYLTAFFNSALFRYCFRDNFPALGDKGRELRKIFFDKIPVMEVTDEQNAVFASLVTRILAAKAAAPAADTSELEAQIDEAVERLYGLAAEERRAAHKRV